MSDDDAFERCARLLDTADGLLITAGAGMGVDAGLPDFRGTDGFWRTYPALGRARLRFEEIANPSAFTADPELAWGFYGHRLNLYRRTEPHVGHHILRRWAESMPRGGFVFTSNVDGLFQKAGFAVRRVCEVHGSIHHLQCVAGCGGEIWPATGFLPQVDDAACRLTSPLPRCPRCGGLARPNILMFGDGGWLDSRQRLQFSALRHWLEDVERPLVIELGAGSQIATVRHFGESLDVPLIRINPTEPAIGHGRGVSLAMGALAALAGIDRQLASG